MNLPAMRVHEVMQKDFPALRGGDRLDLTDPSSRHGRARHLPILDAAGRVLGIASRRDLVESALAIACARAPRLRHGLLRSVAPEVAMKYPVETIDGDAPLGDAALRLILHRIGCLPVVRGDGVMIGLLTEADLLLAAATGLAPPPPAG